MNICLKSQDGYFLGELMNGHRGFVPSNFVEKVAGKGLLICRILIPPLYVCHLM